MNGSRIFLIGVALAAMVQLCRADDANSMAKENAELKQRVDKLEKEVEELKKLVTQQSQVRVIPVTQPVTPAAPAAAAVKPTEPNAAPKLSDADIQRITAMLEKETPKEKPVWSDLDIQLYGYIKGDASYDSARSYPGDYILWVNSKTTNKEGKDFNLTANQSRFGVRINGPDDGDIKTSGVVEVDFYGNATAENKPALLVRHAYLNIEWQKERFSILAGQTSDVISPLWPDTLNYTVMWDAGNIGYRRPQIRLTKSYALSDDVDLKLEGAVARTIGRTDFTDSDSGANAGFPTLQGRTSVTFPSFGYKPATIGVSGHYGREEFDTNASGTTNNKFTSWSNNLDVLQPITEFLGIKGELFTGQDLGTYFGGIGQSVSPTTGIPTEAIKAHGGWIAAALGPWDKWRFNVGIGEDSVDNDDINAGDRRLNRSIFGNAVYSINRNTEVGLELSQWRTDYKGQDPAQSVRAQTSLIYKF